MTKKKPLSPRATGRRPQRAKVSLAGGRVDPFGRLAFAIGHYLESIGWSAVVVGNPRIQQQPDAAQFNFEFVVRFTGGQKK